MWFWAVIAMAGKETLPTLTAMLGVWLLWTAWREKKTAGYAVISPVGGRRVVVKHGAGLIVISTAWFIIATFFIVAPLARQYFGTEGPIYFENRYAGGLNDLWTLLQDPARWQYVLGLFAAVGFLPVLAPELLVLGLPVLAANLLSNFPGQYSGEQHYSAPLAVAFVLAAIYGVRRLVHHISPHKIWRQSLKTTALIAAILWLLTWSLSYHIRFGWTPFSNRTESYAMHPAAKLLPDFTRQIPPNAIVSASAAVHPHLAHRRVIYTFPTMEDAAYLLVDVTDIPGVHPNDARATLMDLLNSKWQLQQADHGLILAQKTVPPHTNTLPDSFFDFARATGPPAHHTDLAFGDSRLKLLGYDVLDDPDDGVTFRFYWHAVNSLPDDLRLWPLVYNDNGRLLNNPVQVPMIAAVWYPPHRWQPNEIIVTETLPQPLPPVFYLGLAVGPPDSFTNPDQRATITHAGHNLRVYPGRWAQLAAFHRQGPFLIRSLPPDASTNLTPVEAQFGPAVHLTGYRLNPSQFQPDGELPLVLQWTPSQTPATNYTVFVHLLAPDGRRIAQHDSVPTWLTPFPTSQWLSNQPVLDRHPLILPSNLPTGTYTLQIGLYNPQTMDRLPLSTGEDTLTLVKINFKQ